MNRGTLFVVSAPSGAGKTTILKKILATMPRIAFSVSHTTRAPRPGEQDGVDYHFVDRPTFEAMRSGNAFVEWAEVHANLYGTSKEAIREKLGQGIDILLDIDVQGARQIRAGQHLAAVSIFIAPPSLTELRNRLTGRGTDDRQTIDLRLANATREMAEMNHYDYVVVNDLLENALETVRSIIVAERCRSRRDRDGVPLSLPTINAS